MKLTKKRGFSLVELMVVVAIMGTLAAIAIPAYNEYRKSAKKTAYKTDMLGFHKGMLAFGVELDSYCERDTAPEEVSISNIGMGSLVSSKLYGTKGLCEIPNPAILNCDCNGQSNTTSCAAHMSSDTIPVACGCTWANTGGNGPGKHNFIGFGGNGATPCSGTALVDTQILGTDTAGATTTADTSCDLGVTEYELGVYGHISGNTGFGVSVNQNGVLSSEVTPTLVAAADANCT